MTKQAILFEALLLLVLASVLALFGAGIPVHFRAVAPGVLVEAGRGTESLDELAILYLDSGKIGPVEIMPRQQNLWVISGSGKSPMV